jgi:Fe-S-cluster containining protein
MSISKKKELSSESACLACSQPHFCCREGAWVDVREAEKILGLGLGGNFFNLEKDDDFPSGYRIATSYNHSRCTFLNPKGLCTIHIADYGLKPAYCKEFPYEDGKLSPWADEVCLFFSNKRKTARIKKARAVRARRLSSGR